MSAGRTDADSPVVSGEADRAGDAPRSVDAGRQRLAHLFRKYRSDPAQDVLYVALVAYRGLSPP
jgi:hypothetical protein